MTVVHLKDENRPMDKDAGNALQPMPFHHVTHVWADAIRPRNMQEAVGFCEKLSRSSICPKALKGDPMAILVAIQAGERHGFDILGSIQNICVINGKPTVYGDGLLGICRSNASFESIEETFSGSMKGGDAVATCIVKRRTDPDPVVRAFRYADAEQAGLVKKAGPWQEYPERMMQMRARAFALRDAFADVLSGLQCREEVEDYAVVDVQTGKATHRPQGHVIDAEPKAGDVPLTRMPVEGVATAEHVPGDLDIVHDYLDMIAKVSLDDPQEGARQLTEIARLCKAEKRLGAKALQAVLEAGKQRRVQLRECLHTSPPVEPPGQLGYGQPDDGAPQDEDIPY